MYQTQDMKPALAWTAVALVIFGVWSSVDTKSGKRRLFKRIFLRMSAAVNHHYKTWRFLLDGAQQIDNGYFKAKGKPYSIYAPGQKMIFVSSKLQARELDKASPWSLSLFAASKEMFQPQYTMHGFDWVDRRGQDGIGYIRALRSILTAHLPTILPDLRTIISSEFSNGIKIHNPNYGFKEVPQSFNLPAFAEIKRIVVQINGYTFFGSDLMQNKAFMHAAFENIEHVVWPAEWIRLMPKILAPIIGRFFSARNKHRDIWYTVLKDTIEQRRQLVRFNLRDGLQDKSYPMDGIQWVIDTAPKDRNWSNERLAHEVMALWFGSVHGLSITSTYALYDLCRHQQYIEPLRAELESPEYAKFVETAEGLPLLDSFLKESARISPMDNMTSRRLALEPFTFLDGTHARKGDTIAMPLRALNNDPELYPHPHEFDGFRFTNFGSDSKNGVAARDCIQPEGPTKLTNVSHKWTMWGNTRMACPARFYASVVIKLILAHVLENYDVEVPEKRAIKPFNWRGYLIPRDNAKILLKPRK